MKKIITFLFCTAVLSSAFAQTNHRDADSRKFDNNQMVYQNNNFRIAERDKQIQRITGQYDYRIQQVSYDRSLSRRQKKITIKVLESEKARDISSVIAQYNSNVYNDSHNRNNDHRQNDRNNGYGQYNR